MSYIDKHLDSNEKILIKCRPARRAYLGEYAVFLIVLGIYFICIYYSILARMGTNYKLVTGYTIASIIFLILAIILLIKVEYKIWFRRYALTNERIMISEGIFTESFKSSVYGKVTDIGLKQSFLDKILDSGTIYVNTAGGDNIEIVFENVANPFEIKSKISDLQPIAEKPIPIKPTRTRR